MGVIANLVRQHSSLKGLAARMLRVLDLQTRDAASVAVLRSQICNAFLSHVRHEDAGVYDPLLRSGDASAVAVARRFREELGAVEQAYRAYMADWPLPRIHAEWDGFKLATQAVLARMIAHCEREDDVLFGHAERILPRKAA